jgi:SAM-dependent methyltransferase
MATTIRQPLEGVCNIIRFNWHFYVAGLFVFGVLLWLSMAFPQYYWINLLAAAAVLLPLLLSLLASFYVYDASGLYQLQWLQAYMPKGTAKMVNIHFGFDETSALLAALWPGNSLLVLDCYDARKHTEVSIKRARAYRPAYPGTIAAQTHHLPLAEGGADVALLLFAAHEIRDQQERIHFFKQLRLGLAPGGRIVVLEHLRDLPNALVYAVGVFHFFPKSLWWQDFAAAGLTVKYQQKINPFVHLFILEV